MTDNNCDGLTFEAATEKAGYCLMLETENAQLEREVDRLRAKSNTYSTMLEESFPAWKFHKQSLVDYAKESIAMLRGDNTKAILEMAKARGLAAEERDHRERLQLILTDDFERTGQFARLFDAMTKAIHDREKSDRELVTIRESEEKAWGLVEEAGRALAGSEQHDSACVDALERITAALAARKAGG